MNPNIGLFYERRLNTLDKLLAKINDAETVTLGMSVRKKVRICNQRVTENGTTRLEKIRSMLANYGEHSLQQVMFQELCVQSCIPLIYGGEYERQQVNIMRINNIDRIAPMVLIQCPRRFGKSRGIAILIAILLLVMPGIKIVLIAPGKRQCNMMKDEYILDMVSDLIASYGIHAKYKVKKEDELTLIVEGTKRTLSLLPMVEQVS